MSTLNDTTDATVWAEEFCRIFAGKFVNQDVGQDVMVAWFANAIETGRNAGRKETCPHDDMFDIAGEMRACRTCGMLNPGG